VGKEGTEAYQKALEDEMATLLERAIWGRTLQTVSGNIH